MSKHATKTTFGPGDSILISGRATRRGLHRGRRTPSPTGTQPVAAVAAVSTAAERGASQPRPRRLRRWSVADLIAQAAARPPVAGNPSLKVAVAALRASLSGH